jgi:hypothetical protein
MGQNQKRIALILSNTSIGGQVITISLEKEAVTGAGIVLYPGGSWDRSPEQKPPQAKISAISSAAGGLLSVYEESE